jgi:hypothetical protein
MIIVGNRRRNKVMGQVRYTCKKCQQNSFHGIVRSRMYFTLFFVPIFPLNKITTSRCGLCGYQEYVNNKEMDEYFAKQGAGAPTS